MTKIVEAWDNLDFAEGKRTRPDHVDVEFRIGDRVVLTFDLTEEHLQELIEHNARWIAVGQQVPPEVRAVAGAARAGRAGQAHNYQRQRAIRRFADAAGRSQEYIRPGWKPADGSRNKYQYSEELTADYDSWVAAGSPPLEAWQRRQAS